MVWVCLYMYICTCVVSMCCNSCPFITLHLLVLLHKSCVPHQLTHDAHNMTYAQYYYLSTLWPFSPPLLIYFKDLQLRTITYQHRIAQYLMGACTLTKTYRWASTHTMWYTYSEESPSGVKISSQMNIYKNQFHSHGAADRKYTHLQVLVLTCTQSCRLLCDHTCSMLEVPCPHTCTNAGTFLKVQFILSYPCPPLCPS